VEDLLLKDIDALVITSISDALTPVVRRASEQGVKVVLGEQPLEGFDDYVTIVGPDQREAAAAGADFVVDQLGSDIEVAFLTAPGISVVEERGDAAREVFEKAGADIVAEGPAPDCGLPPAINSSEDILQAHPNVDLIYGLCAPPDLGAIKAISQANLVPNRDVHVFGFDGLPEEFKEIQAGRLLGTIDQRPDLQGKAAAEAAIAAARGEEVPRTTFSDAIVVNKSNVEDAIAANREATKN
jgi:ribose transport system substrate-binding protein